MIAPEVRKGGRRVAFKIADIASGREGFLAVTDPRLLGLRGLSGPRFGRYVIVEGDVERVGVRALLDALAKADVIVIDEIGPMELFSRSLEEAIIKSLKSSKPVVSVFHRRLSKTHPHIYRLLESSGCMAWVDEASRRLIADIVGEIADAISSKASCG